MNLIGWIWRNERGILEWKTKVFVLLLQEKKEFEQKKNNLSGIQNLFPKVDIRIRVESVNLTRTRFFSNLKIKMTISGE